MAKTKSSFIRWFNTLGIKDVPLVGGKNASLGEMYRKLVPKGVRVPNGFAITAKAYFHLLKAAGIKKEIRRILKDLNTKDLRNLQARGHAVRTAILGAAIPDDLVALITAAYRKLEAQYGVNVDVAVRSSATAEDLPSISSEDFVHVRVNGAPTYQRMRELYQQVGAGAGYRLEVPAMTDGEVAWRPVEQIYAHQAAATTLYRIRTVTGRELTVSPNHTLIVLDEDTLQPKEVSSIRELTGRERLPVVRQLPVGDRLAQADPVSVLAYVTGDDVAIDQGLVKIKNRGGNWRIQQGLTPEIPATRDLAYFLGVYAAEGSTYGDNCVMVTSTNPEVIAPVRRFLRSLGLDHGRPLNKFTLRVYSKPLLRLLHGIAGRPDAAVHGKGKLAKGKTVPPFVFGWPPELVGAFLRGCFDGDGYAGAAEVQYTSVSERLVGGITVLLTSLGINYLVGRKGNALTITVQRDSHERFRELVGFTVRRKAHRLARLVRRYRSTKHQQFFNRIPITQSVSNRLRREFEAQLPKEWVNVSYCPDCTLPIEQTSSYRGRTRWYCRLCRRAHYEVAYHREMRYVPYDIKGRFLPAMVPWNKAQFSGSFSQARAAQVATAYRVDTFQTVLSQTVLWDQIKEITPIQYNGLVYDFVVPRAENFAAGMGGIITHNSASFAGQQDTYLNIRGVPALLDACKRCFASLFTDRAISYRTDKRFDHFKVGLSIGVQKMVRSDRACSGVMFSIDTETGFRDAVLINASYGLGENIVQGAVTPDEYYIHKPTLKKGFKPIIGRQLGDKKIKMIYGKAGGKATLNVPTSRAERTRFALSDAEVLALARWACVVESHYRKPMDLEWAKDGVTGKLFIVQARPETVQSRRDTSVLEEYVLHGHGKVLASGAPVGSKIGAGKARVIRDVAGIHQFKAGEVLVTEITDPDWEPIMKVASAIVTDLGGRTSHAAIVSRELGIPCIVGTGTATAKIKTGQAVTVSCAEGNVGHVYAGALKFEVRKHNLNNLKRPKTKVMINVGSPDIAFASSFIPNDGVGLAREEFIINDQIKIHPNALLDYKKLKSVKVKRQINALTVGYPNKVQFYVDKLAEGVGKIAAAFYPKDVIVRFSDFKTNEYANLVGGAAYEPSESNPMIGWRGSSRYYDPKFKAAFALECRAIHKVREVMGLTNLKVMVPFCRTITEAKAVLAVMAANGLKSGVNGLEVYVMCEIPSNVILAEEFAQLFDGFSIGSNDLTQLTLGVDRDSELVSHVYDERNLAVKTLISQVIKAAKKHRRKIGICGQAPSDFPDFAQFLVQQGIDSISLNPDTVVKTTIAILRTEAKVRKK